jgi:outer membrane protein assembly factor BamB
MKKLFILTLLLTGCSTIDDRVTEKESKQVVEKHTTPIVKPEILKPIRIKAMTAEISESDTVGTVIEDRHYTLFPDGKIAVRLNSTGRVDTFHLETQNVIEKAHFLDYKNDLIIYYTDTDYETGASFIESYDRETNKLKWKNDIYGFNLSTPIVVGNLTYVASIGFVGKLNLDNGQYLWKHEDLYEKTRFNSFSKIEIDGDRVSFIETTYAGDTKIPGRIIVNDKTGEIEKIIKNTP